MPQDTSMTKGVLNALGKGAVHRICQSCGSSVPNPSLFDVSNQAATYAVTCREYLLFGRGVTAYFIHLFLCQFGAWILFASRGVKSCSLSMFCTFRRASFAIPVRDIFLVGSKEKMARVTAWWVVTRMAYLTIGWGMSVFDGVSDAIRTILFLPYFDRAVATIKTCGGPRPAFVSPFLFNLCLESLNLNFRQNRNWSYHG